MSASPMARPTTEYKAIPKRILINDINDLPNDYSSTPGGTLYSTTPGGTKIVYEKSFLLSLRNSPVSKTPPTYNIPEQILSNNQNNNRNISNNNNNKIGNKPRGLPMKRNPLKPPNNNKKHEDSELFDLEI